MHQRRSHIIALALVAAFLIGCMTVLAGPFLQNPAPRDTLLSLAAMEHVRVSASRLPPELRELQMTHEAVLEQLKRGLERGGVRVVETGNVPSVDLLLLVATDEDLADALAFNVRLTVLQPALIDRLQRRLTVPTFTDFVIGLEPRADVTATVRSSIDVLTEKLTRTVRIVTAIGRHQEGGEGTD